jgi:hypothetical protein
MDVDLSASQNSRNQVKTKNEEREPTGSFINGHHVVRIDGHHHIVCGDSWGRLIVSDPTLAVT